MSVPSPSSPIGDVWTGEGSTFGPRGLCAKRVAEGVDGRNTGRWREWAHGDQLSAIDLTNDAMFHDMLQVADGGLEMTREWM